MVLAKHLFISELIPDVNVDITGEILLIPPLFVESLAPIPHMWVQFLYLSVAALMNCQYLGCFPQFKASLTILKSSKTDKVYWDP